MRRRAGSSQITKAELSTSVQQDARRHSTTTRTSTGIQNTEERYSGSKGSGEEALSQSSKPTSIYSLALAGIILQVLGLVAFGFGMVPFGFGMMGGYGGMMGGYYGTGGSFFLWWSAVWLAVGLAIIGLGIYGLRLVSSNNLQSVHNGSVILLITSVIAFPTMWGFFVGSALLFAAAIIGLSWQPMTQMQQETAPT